MRCFDFFFVLAVFFGAACCSDVLAWKSDIGLDIGPKPEVLTTIDRVELDDSFDFKLDPDPGDNTQSPNTTLLDSDYPPSYDPPLPRRPTSGGGLGPMAGPMAVSMTALMLILIVVVVAIVASVVQGLLYVARVIWSLFMARKHN